MITLTHYLVLSTIIFCIGVYGLLTRRSVLSFYMCIELIFNAANINFVAFSYYLVPHTPVGQIFAMFILAVSAAEFGVGIAIILLLFRQLQSTMASDASLMEG